MERINRDAVARSASAVILGLLLSFSIGCSPGAYHGEVSPWSRKGHPEGFFGKDISERVLKHVDKQVEALNLSPEQREKYVLIRESMRTDFSGMREMRSKFAKEVREEIMKEKPDPHRLAALLTRHAGSFQGFVEQGTKRFLEFYDILDDSQKSKVIEHLRDRAAKFPVKSEIPGASVGSLWDRSCPPAQEQGRRLEPTPYQQEDQMASRSIGELM